VNCRFDGAEHRCNTSYIISNHMTGVGCTKIDFATMFYSLFYTELKGQLCTLIFYRFT
jgi:hypothetical protein